MPFSRIGRRDVRVARGGQEIVRTVRVTLLVNLRDDSIQCGQDSPCLIFVVVYSGSELDFTIVLYNSYLYS